MSLTAAMRDNTRERLTAYAASLRYEDLTAAAVHAVKRSVIDSIGCALGASAAEPIQALYRLASQVSAVSPATVIGTAIKTSPEWAAFASGAMVRYSDFSDDYFGGSGDTGPHPSDNIGALLAATESAGSDGKALVLGIALAYEVCGQLVDATALRVRGWDHPLLHAIATSLGAGKVLGLSREQLGHALSLATVANVSLFQTRLGEISNWKGLAGPNGSRNGLVAALLAKEGITGPPEPFEGRAGLMKQLGNPFELGAFGGAGTPYKVERTYFKYLPLRYEMQLPVWIAFELRERVKVGDIESIDVYIEKRCAIARDENPQHWNPTSRETADHSGPYLIGAALVDGAITHDTFTPARYRDPVILGLVDRIRLLEDAQYTAAFPGRFDCRFEVALKAGDRLTLHQANPKGHPANPMSDAEIEDKFLKQVRHVLADDQSRALLDALWDLENVADMGRLVALMCTP